MIFKIYHGGGRVQMTKMARSKGLRYHTCTARNEPSECIMPRDPAAMRSSISLCSINSAQRSHRHPCTASYLGLFKSVTVTLAYFRHNRTQAEIGESFDVSQLPTISRAISAITPLIEEGLAGQAPTADELDLGTQYIVDGTLLPCWSWAAHPELSPESTRPPDEHPARVTIRSLAWISDPVNGAGHDNYCLGESGALLTLNPETGSAIRAMLATRSSRRSRSQPAVSRSTCISYQCTGQQICWVIEQVILHFKNWRIMHTDYRRPIKTFATTIPAVVGLHFYRMA